MSTQQVAGTTLTMHFDNSAALFVPDRKVRIIANGVDYGVFKVVEWEHGLRLINEETVKQRRLSKTRAAYRARRR